jgi:hypothetical protein
MNGMRLVIWSVAAAAAIGVTTTAVTVANATGGGRDDVLSQNDVSNELAEGATPSTPEPTPTNVTGEPVTFELTAGRLVVQCDGDQSWLASWSPNPGYRVDDVLRGPAAEVSAWFESDSHDDVKVAFTCDGNKPDVTELVEPDDHGGDRDDDDHDDDDDGDNSGPGGGGNSGRG